MDVITLIILTDIKLICLKYQHIDENEKTNSKLKKNLKVIKL